MIIYDPTMEATTFKELLVIKLDLIMREKRYKARLTARGDPVDDLRSYHSSVVPSEVMKILVAMVVGRKIPFEKWTHPLHIRVGD